MNDATRQVVKVLRRGPASPVAYVARPSSHPVFDPLPVSREMELAAAAYLVGRPDAEVLALHALMYEIEG